MPTALLGIRHHGPGSARSVVAALDELRPTCVLIEGPPEADAVAALAADDDLVPPVALLAYVVDRPRRASAWPMAAFSPEWQALRWALAAGVVVRFCDLPARTSLAAVPRAQLALPLDAAPPDERDDGEGSDGRRGDEPDGDEPDGDDPDGEAVVPATGDQRRDDPIAALASAAGYADAERWWEDAVELDAGGGLATFAAVAEAMGAVRASVPPLREGTRTRWREDRREASMRQALRAARKEGHARIAVVCGAWHVPALRDPLPAAAADARLLRGLPKVKVAVTWVPWTSGRLSWRSGYGAGVDAPGWYAHLFAEPRDPEASWLVRCARLLRAEGFAAPSASAIDAVRLARTLAALRGRPAVGLAELDDAAASVLGGGSDVALRLVRDRLVVGDAMGSVPAGTPQLPLRRDLDAAQRRLRLKPSPEPRDLVLDLRRELDLERSRLLHRLRLLDVPWGEPQPGRPGAVGTFAERWALRWDPALEVALLEASRYGTTVPAAAAARAAERAAAARTLDALSELAEEVLLADLAEASAAVLRALADRAALAVDVPELLRTAPPLARTLRYRDVRRTDAGLVEGVLRGVAARIDAGLPSAAAALDAAAAEDLRDALDGYDAAVGLLADAALLAGWTAALRRTADRDGAAPLVAGRAWRLLLDRHAVAPDDVGAALSRASSPGTPAAAAAAWIEGFLTGGGALLLHDPTLLGLVDAWLAELPEATFTDALPLVRRTFATFTPPERRALAERLRARAAAAMTGTRPDGAAALTAGPDGTAAEGDGIDWDLAEVVLAGVAPLLGERTAP